MEDSDYPLLTPIKRADSDARTRIISAEGEAKNELRATRLIAEDMVKAAERTAREEVAQMIADARNRGEGEARDILERSLKGIEAMKIIAGKRMKDARGIIVESITGAR